MAKEKPSYGFFEGESDESIAADAERLSAILQGIAAEMDKTMIPSGLDLHLWSALTNQLRAASDMAKAVGERFK